jgi:serine/threonine protein kinase
MHLGRPNRSNTAPLSMKRPQLSGKYSHDTQVRFEGNRVRVMRQDILIQEFILTKRLGQGTQGNVYHVYQEQTKTEYALKRVSVPNEEGMEIAKREVEHVLQLQHKHIVPIHHLFEHVSVDDYEEQYTLYFTMDLYACGDLAFLISQYKLNRKYFSQSQMYHTVYQISDALSYIHKKRMVHRDIKPQNIFVKRIEPLSLIVGDFGLSKMIQSISQRHSYVGSLNTMSPGMSQSVFIDYFSNIIIQQRFICKQSIVSKLIYSHLDVLHL